MARAITGRHIMARAMVRAGAVKLTLMVAGSGRGFADCYSFETNRRSGYGACEHVVCGAQQPQHQDALSPDDASYKRFLKEDGKPRTRDGVSFPLLQFRADP